MNGARDSPEYYIGIDFSKGETTHSVAYYNEKGQIVVDGFDIASRPIEPDEEPFFRYESPSVDDSNYDVTEQFVEGKIYEIKNGRIYGEDGYSTTARTS